MVCVPSNNGSQTLRHIRPPGYLLTMLTWGFTPEDLIWWVWGGQESAAGPGAIPCETLAQGPWASVDQ